MIYNLNQKIISEFNSILRGKVDSTPDALISNTLVYLSCGGIRIQTAALFVHHCARRRRNGNYILVLKRWSKKKVLLTYENNQTYFIIQNVQDTKVARRWTFSFEDSQSTNPLKILISIDLLLIAKGYFRGSYFVNCFIVIIRKNMSGPRPGFSQH